MRRRNEKRLKANNKNQRVEAEAVAMGRRRMKKASRAKRTLSRKQKVQRLRAEKGPKQKFPEREDSSHLQIPLSLPMVQHLQPASSLSLP